MTGRAARPAGSGRWAPRVAGILVLLAAAAATIALVGCGGKGNAPTDQREAPRPVLVSLDTFLVNLADPRGDRYLKATLHVALDDPELAAELRTDELLRSRVRDRVLAALAAKTFDEISTPAGREALRGQLRRVIDEALPDDVVSEVLFVEFVAQ